MNTKRSSKDLAGLSLATLLALIIGCQAIVAHAKGLPSWVESPPADGENHYYGIGQGKSLPIATQSALEAVAGKLMTNVESTSVSATQIEDNIAKSEFASQIKSQVAKTNLANYSVESTKKSGKDFFILIKVDKSSILKANQDSLKELMSDIKGYFGRMDQMGSLAVKEDSAAITEKIRQARSKALISRSLDSSYDHTVVSTTLRQYEDQLSKKTANQAIYVSCTPQLKTLAQKIANQLTNEGYTVTLTKPKGNATTIHLSGNYREYDQFQQKHVTANTNVSVTNELGQAIYTSELVLNGASMMSYDSAKNIAVNRYMQELELQGAAYTFGLADE